jgi:L-cysteine S-thiosulfotransferase
MIRLSGGRVSRTGRRIAVAGVGLGALLCIAGESIAGQCKMKTAGYFKELENAAPGLPKLAAGGGIERSLTGALGDPQKGRTLMISANKGNCIACHRVAALSSEPSHGDLGPTLNGVGSRYNEAQLRQLVINPRLAFQNTIMPAYHVTEGLERVQASFAGQPILSAAEVEDVVAFLKTLR